MLIIVFNAGTLASSDIGVTLVFLSVESVAHFTAVTHRYKELGCRRETARRSVSLEVFFEINSDQQ